MARIVACLYCDSHRDILTSGALLLQVPERVLMSTSSAARDADFTAASQRYPGLAPEQERILHSCSHLCVE
jgi:hypothetical protein